MRPRRPKLNSRAVRDGLDDTGVEFGSWEAVAARVGIPVPVSGCGADTGCE
jgi:hypothetical protein